MKATEEGKYDPVVSALRHPASPNGPPGKAGEAGKAGKAEAGVLLDFEHVPMHGVEWLWPGWLPRGKTTLLAGSGGSGKGTLAAHLMACATNRKAWPDGTVSDPCTAVIVSPDDAASDTLKPRLHFSGVNFKRCLRMNSKAVDSLRKCRDAGLVIIDIVEAGMGFGTDGNAAGDVARHISRFNRIAENINAAVVVVHHVNKWIRAKVTEGSLANLVRGSGAWTDACRMAWLITADENDETGSRVLVRAKSNLGGVNWRDGGFRVFAKNQRFDGENGQPGVTTVIDRMTPLTGNAYAIFAAAVTPADPAAPAKAGKQRFARDAILDLLTPGAPLRKAEAIAVLTGRNHAQRTIERAADELQHGGKLIARKRAPGEFPNANNNAVIWELPALPASPALPCGEIGETEGDADGTGEIAR